MSKLLSVFLLFFSLSSVNCLAQTITTDVPFHMAFDSSYVVGHSMIDSFDINQNFQGYNTGQFVLCQDAVFTFKGNLSSSSPTFYLLNGATLILKDSYFYPQIYMADSSVLDAQGGNQNIICYRENSCVLSDTSNVNWLTDSVVNNINFTFMNWPNASAPCTISHPQSVSDIQELKLDFYVKDWNIHYTIDNQKWTDFTIFDLKGKRQFRSKIKGSGEINLFEFASGFYIIQFTQQQQKFTRKIYIP